MDSPTPLDPTPPAAPGGPTPAASPSRGDSLLKQWPMRFLIALGLLLAILLVIGRDAILGREIFQLGLVVGAVNLMMLAAIFLLSYKKPVPGGADSPPLPGDVTTGWWVRLKLFVTTHDLFLTLIVGAWMITYSAVVDAGQQQSELGLWLRTVGIAVIGAGVGGYLTRSRTTLGFFREAIADIVFGSKHLEARSDLQDIWMRVSKAIVRGKFPAIADGMLNEMMALYLLGPEAHYREEFVHFEVIEWEDEKKQRIKVTTTTTYNLVPANPDETVTIDTRVAPEPSKGALGDETVIELTVDGVDYKKSFTPANTITAEKATINGTAKIFDEKLRGKAMYPYKRVRVRTFDPRKDVLALHSFSHPVRTPRVDIHNNAPGLRVRFIAVGTGQTWCDARTKKEFELSAPVGQDQLSVKYKGVALPNQGYCIEYVVHPA